MAVNPSPNPAGCLAQAEVLSSSLLGHTHPATASPEEEERKSENYMPVYFTGQRHRPYSLVFTTAAWGKFSFFFLPPAVEVLL